MADFERLDAALRSVGAPAASLPHRPATHAEVDAACAAAGVTPVAGLHAWYGWRNCGSVVDGTLRHARLVGRMALVDLEVAVDQHRRLVAATADLDDDEFPYRPGWFPILIGADSSGVVCVDCHDRPGTIVLYDPVVEHPASPDERIAGSVDELVDRYVTAIEAGWVHAADESWPGQFRLDIPAPQRWVYSSL